MTEREEERGTALLITGARVYTADPQRPWAEAVAIVGNRIAYVGGAEEARARAGSGAQELHVPGGLALPGLNDSHIHTMWGGRNLGILNLEGVESPAELTSRLRDYAATYPDRPWIEGYGLPYEPLQGLGYPERELLDAAVPDRPVLVYAMDMHSAWVNSPALRLAGIERGATVPPPNEVVVDPATGLASGMLKERLAVELITCLMNQPTSEQEDEMLRRAMRYLNSLGVTSVQNMNGAHEDVLRYSRLRQCGELTVRAAHYLNVREDTPHERLAEFAAYTQRYTDPWNHVRGVKFFIDGVIEAQTALMLRPYTGVGGVGVPDMDPGVYGDFVLEADRLEMDIATHAIGDRAVRLVLDAYEAAQKAHGGRRGRRHRVEHIEVIDPADMPRLAALGVTASMQPLHSAPTGDPRTTTWTQFVGPEREPYAFAWRTILETGAHLAFGSDWPIVTPDARAGLFVALTRQNMAGIPLGGWQPQQGVTLAQALEAYTRGAAYAEGQERHKGTLRAGMLADLTVFAQDLFTLSPAEVQTAQVALTVVDGQVVYRA